MEYRHLPGGDGAYYSVDGYPLRDGLRAAIGARGKVPPAFAAVRGLSGSSCRCSLIAALRDQSQMRRLAKKNRTARVAPSFCVEQFHRPNVRFGSF
jgi:hypothetical protein